MLVAIIQVYNDIDGAKRLHKELAKHGIFSIWGEGRFCDFEQINGSDLSTDGTREFIQAQNDTVLLDLVIFQALMQNDPLFHSLPAYIDILPFVVLFFLA